MVAPADGNYGAEVKYGPAGATNPIDAVDALVLGRNNERLEELKPELVNALRELVRQYRAEGIAARRHEIRRIRQARLFWQGLQYAWWNPSDMNWHLPYESRSNDDRQLEEMPRYQFVTNFYQGFGLSFVAVLSQDVPSVRFYPQSSQSLEDIATARAASDVADLIEQNNQVEKLLTAIGYFLWTDGKLGAYVRYVADAQRFGSHDENLIAAIEIPLGEDKYVCAACGKETAAKRSAAESGDEADDGNQKLDASTLDGWGSFALGARDAAPQPTPRPGNRVPAAAHNLPPTISQRPSVSPSLVLSAHAVSPTARKKSPSPADWN